MDFSSDFLRLMSFEKENSSKVLKKRTTKQIATDFLTFIRHSWKVNSTATKTAILHSKILN